MKKKHRAVQINRATNMMSERQSNKSELPWIEYQNENGRFRKPCIIEIILSLMKS